MELKYGYPRLRGGRKNFIALGTFDGVHIGHQKLIRAMVAQARNTGSRSIVVSFKNHPRQLLQPVNTPFILTPSRLKTFLIGKLGVESMVLLPFDRKLAEMEPLEFVKNVLVECFEPAMIFVGFNFTFGYKGAGTPDFLGVLGKELGFGVNTLSPVCLEGAPVSSTVVRRRLAAGDILGARKCLGHWPIYQGEVIRGDGLGKTLGYPTANLAMPQDILFPPAGVYYGKVLLGGIPYDGVANIGFRPTVSAHGSIRFEIHILNFQGNLYGRELMFFVKQKIRDERVFSNVEELRKQINLDIASIESIRGT